MEIRSVSGNGIEFMIKEEGCILHPYKDRVGIWTIGVGCTYYTNGERVKPTDPSITKDDAILLFKSVLRHYETTVWSMTRDDINQNQFDALVSLCYNIGSTAFKTSTLLKRVNGYAASKDIEQAFTMWRNAGGKPVLLPRRQREAALYNKTVNT